MFKHLRRALPVLLAASAGFLGAFFLFRAPPPDVVSGALNATFYIDGLGLKMTDGSNFYTVGLDQTQGILTCLDRIPTRGVFPEKQEGAAVILTQLSGLNRCDTYLAATAVRHGRVRGSNAICLGQDVLVVDVEVLDEMIWVHYLESDRSGGDRPAEPVIRQFIYRKGILVALS